MEVEIYPVKKMPEYSNPGGDYYYTQSALMLAVLSDGETILKNCNRSIATERTVNFLKTMGYNIDCEEDTIRIESNEGLQLPENRTLNYEGEIFPLSLIIGFLAGLNQACFLEYSSLINQDIIDKIVDIFNKNGIDLFHRPDSRTIIIRAGTNLPVETKVCSSNSYLKNGLLMFGLSSGNSVTVRETIQSSINFENCIKKSGVPIAIEEPGTKIKEDPYDPRKKIRVAAADYKRELVVPSDAKIESSEIVIPDDFETVSSFLTLAILKKKDISLKDVVLNSERMKFIDHLRIIGAEVTIQDRKLIDGISIGTIGLRCKNVKSRKFAGEHTLALFDEIPFLAILAVCGSDKTIIRGIDEYNDRGLIPFNEIADNLDKMGIKCGILEDGLVIEGTGEINGADFGPFNNRKIALVFYLAALAGQGVSTFNNFELVADSYPDIVSMLANVSGRKIVSQKGV